ncbi:hypothetical protein BST61_g1969 [Cercospora zeina]
MARREQSSSKHITKLLAKVHRWVTVLPSPDGTYILLSEKSCSTGSGTELVHTRIESTINGRNFVFSSKQPLNSLLWLDCTILIWSVTKNDESQIWYIDMNDTTRRERMAGCTMAIGSNMQSQMLDESTYELAFISTHPDSVTRAVTDPSQQSSGILYTEFPLRFARSYRPAVKTRLTVYLVSLERAGPDLRVSQSRPRDVLDGLNICLGLWPDLGSFALGSKGLLLSKASVRNATTVHKELIYLENISRGQESARKATKLGYESWNGDFSSFSISHDGCFAVFLQSQNLESCFDHESIFVVALSRSEQTLRVNLVRDQQPWEPRILSVAWSAQSSACLYATVDEDGTVSVWIIELSADSDTKDWTGRAMPVLRSGCTSSIFPLSSPANQEKVLTVRSTFDRAGIIETISMDADRQSRVDLITEHSVPASSTIHERVCFQGATTTVSAFVHKPRNWQHEKQYPLVIMLHGGPNDAWRDCWRDVWNPSVWTNQGYVVITPNISGSTGFGLPFATSIYQNWGGVPLRDVEGLFSYIEKSMRFIDLTRVIGVGYSFGGYMMQWIAGHELAARFRALIVHAGVYSTRNLMGADVPTVMKMDFGCFPWEDGEQWEQWDPSRRCQNWRTPMFFSHGDLDYRIPISESVAAYNTCQIRGVPSQFLVFPDEGHTIRKPQNIAHLQEAMLEWAGRWDDRD